MDILALCRKMVILFFCMATGFAAAKGGAMDLQSNKKLSALVVNIANPMQILASALTGEHLPDVPVDAMPVLKSCNLLNESCRNSLAHQLTAVTAEQITAACGMQPAQLLNQVGKLIAAIYPECDPALFTIYKRCGDYIKSRIL